METSHVSTNSFASLGQTITKTYAFNEAHDLHATAMIYFFIGPDGVRRQKAMEAEVKAALKAKPGAAVFRFMPETWDPVEFESALSGQSFFETDHIIVCSGIFAEKTVAEYLCAQKDTIRASAHTVFFNEEKIDKATLKLFPENKNTVVQNFPLVKANKDSSGALFVVAHAIARGDKKSAWVAFQEGVESGVAAEEMLWPVAWKIKDSLTKNRNSETLKKTSRNLVVAYHESMRGGLPLDLALEKLILSL